jgi:hypothetical protein
VREIPDDAVNLSAPAGTPAASAAEFAPIWCAHGVKHEWQADQGGYLPMVLEVDEIHSDIPIVSPGALPGCVNRRPRSTRPSTRTSGRGRWTGCGLRCCGNTPSCAEFSGVGGG